MPEPEPIAKAGYLTPLVPVADIERSIRFYARLGFTTVDTDRAMPLGWARLHCEGSAIMFVRAESAVDASAVQVLFYLYTPDLSRLRADLAAAGVAVPAIAYPGYMPSGELCLADPDGYRIAIGHWGQTEHDAWLKRIGEPAQ